MNGFTAHLTYEVRTGFRDASLMLMNYLFPLGFLLMAGLFMTQLNPFFTDIMVPGMVTFGLMSASLLNLSGTVIREREEGIYRSYKVNGVPASSLTYIPITAALLHALLVSALITAVSILLFGGSAPVQWGWFVLIILLTSISVSSVGLLIGIASPSQRAGILLAQAIYIPSVLLSGIMIPQNVMPENLQFFIFLLPTSYSIRGFNDLAMNTQQLSAETLLPLLVLAAGTAVQLLLCRLLFQWDSKIQNPKKSLLAFTAFIPYILGSVYLMHFTG